MTMSSRRLPDPIPDKTPLTKDQTVPAYHIYKLKRQELTTTDLLLIWAINDLTKPREEQPGEGLGCSATDRELAQIVRRNLTYVSARIKKLIDQGELLEIHFQGRRYLEVEWHRTMLDKLGLPSCYRAAYEQAEEKAAEMECEPKSSQRRGEQ